MPMSSPTLLDHFSWQPLLVTIYILVRAVAYVSTIVVDDVIPCWLEDRVV